MQIAVIGSGEAKGKLYKIAEEVGEEIAKAGAALVCGGWAGPWKQAQRGRRSRAD